MTRRSSTASVIGSRWHEQEEEQEGGRSVAVGSEAVAAFRAQAETVGAAAVCADDAWSDGSECGGGAVADSVADGDRGSGGSGNGAVRAAAGDAIARVVLVAV